jgi:hypothetical protein
LLEPARIRFVSGSILVLSLILLGLSFASAREGGRTLFGPGLGADFAGFYTAGYILDHDPPAKLYDRSFQDKVHHELHPYLAQRETLPFVHPPFVAWAFRPLSRLPYAWSFAVWLVLSLGLYLAGICLALRTVTPLPALLTDRLSIFLLVLSFEPFVMECWLGGQISAVGFFVVAACLALDHSGRPLLAGMVLGLCFYKPTLLVVLLPVLLAARQFWTLLGVTLTGIGLALLSWATVGREGIQAFVDAALRFSRDTTQSGELTLPLAKFVDLNTFTRLLLGPSLLQRVLFLALALPPLGLLLWRAWQVRRGDGGARLTLLASAILATPVLNIYVGIYDSILAVLGTLVLVGMLTRRRAALPPRFQLWLLALFIVPWFTQPLARLPGVHLQLFTVVLLGLTLDVLLEKERTHDGSRVAALNGPDPDAEIPAGQGQ